MTTQNARISLEACSNLIRDVPDFPKKGIVFKDITPLLDSGPHFQAVVNYMADVLESRDLQIDVLAGPEARGFIFGAALAFRLGVGFVPIRKPGKLPHDVSRVEYALEYGTDSLEMHADAVSAGQNVGLVDDLLATGGTTAACAEMVTRAGANVAACVFLIELDFLEGRSKLLDHRVHSLIHY